MSCRNIVTLNLKNEHIDGAILPNSHLINFNNYLVINIIIILIIIILLYRN